MRPWPPPFCRLIGSGLAVMVGQPCADVTAISSEAGTIGARRVLVLRQLEQRAGVLDDFVDRVDELVPGLFVAHARARRRRARDAKAILRRAQLRVVAG